MNEITIGTLAAIMIIGVVGILAIITKQQQTIDRLTDKLMAKDYREYTQLSRPVVKDDKTIRKPLSWHDDPSIEIEEEDAH